MATEGGGEPSKKYDRIIKIFKADIPESMQEKAILRVNQGMDKFQIEKVRELLYTPPLCHYSVDL